MDTTISSGKIHGGDRLRRFDKSLARLTETDAMRAIREGLL
jgi:hypothetical protein